MKKPPYYFSITRDNFLSTHVNVFMCKLDKILKISLKF